jgi:two-component system chemotaxis response regulator CheY
MVESALLGLGYLNIQSADDGVEALELCDSDEFDFIITDINMPNMDGITLIEHLRNRLDYMSTPILVLTTERTVEMKTKGKQAGATAWMVKPFDQDLLHRAILETIKKVEEE